MFESEGPRVFRRFSDVGFWTDLRSSSFNVFNLELQASEGKPRPRPNGGGRLSRPFPGGFLLKFSFWNISMRPTIVVGKNWPTKIFFSQIWRCKLEESTKKSCQNPFNQQMSHEFSTFTTHHLTSGITSSQESLPFPSQISLSFLRFFLGFCLCWCKLFALSLDLTKRAALVGGKKPVGDF